MAVMHEWPYSPREPTINALASPLPEVSVASGRGISWCRPRGQGGREVTCTRTSVHWAPFVLVTRLISEYMPSAPES
jgi:hypothetical protein